MLLLIGKARYHGSRLLVRLSRRELWDSDCQGCAGLAVSVSHVAGEALLSKGSSFAELWTYCCNHALIS